MPGGTSCICSTSFFAQPSFTSLHTHLHSSRHRVVHQQCDFSNVTYYGVLLLIHTSPTPSPPQWRPQRQLMCRPTPESRRRMSTTSSSSTASTQVRSASTPSLTGILYAAQYGAKYWEHLKRVRPIVLTTVHSICTRQSTLSKSTQSTSCVFELLLTFSPEQADRCGA